MAKRHTELSFKHCIAYIKVETNNSVWTGVELVVAWGSLSLPSYCIHFICTEGLELLNWEIFSGQSGKSVEVWQTHPILYNRWHLVHNNQLVGGVSSVDVCNVPPMCPYLLIRPTHSQNFNSRTWDERWWETLYKRDKYEGKVKPGHFYHVT